MKILALEKEFKGKTANDFQPYLKAEARRVWELYKEGIIREIYFQADHNRAVLVLECANKNEAKEKLSTLPLVRELLIDFDIIELRTYPGFERLIENK